jgi:subtilisin family serine protease
MARPLDARQVKVQPKLRMVANGSTEVNALRAEHAAAVKVSPQEARRRPALRTQRSAPVAQRFLTKAEKTTRKLAEPPRATVSAFLRLREDLTEATQIPHTRAGITARKANLATAELSPADAVALRDEPWVAHVELGQPLAAPTPVVATKKPGSPSLAARRFGDGRRHRFGEGVLVGLIDVGGFDFAHPDFLDNRRRTRFVSIWDQGGATRPSPAERRGLDLRADPEFAWLDQGAELRKDDLDRAIASSSTEGLPAQRLEPQSQMEEGSHATHVASIAAGNRGLCRRAFIAGVLISIPADAQDRRSSFYDSSRIAHAVDYLYLLADELAREHGLDDVPVSINVSLGTNGHAHDDSAAISRWIDAGLTRPGRNVCVAAGNAGQERAESEQDFGWVMGRVHSSGRIAARELVHDLEWTVVGNGVSDISENELEIWYGPQDRLAVQVKPPSEDWTDPVEPGQFIENRQLSDDTFLSVYNELYSPANGCNYIAVYLSPLLREPKIVGVQAGLWLVRLIGREIRDGGFHCWIERDDPRRIGRIGHQDAWVFPSFFSERSFVDSSTVSSLACGHRIVSVANLDERGRKINITSSQGPTRDNRQKPDIAAPGTDIVAAKGFAPAGDDWVAMSGTSMASPFVAGVVGLMLAANPKLTGAQLGGIIKRSAKPLPGHDFSWRDDAGSGHIDPARCVEEATAMLELEDVTEPVG